MFLWEGGLRRGEIFWLKAAVEFKQLKSVSNVDEENDPQPSTSSGYRGQHEQMSMTDSAVTSRPIRQRANQ